jgi:hypothetical protein
MSITFHPTLFEVIRKFMSSWRQRQNATTITGTDPRTERFRVRELRQARWHSDAREAQEESNENKETAEAEQAKSLAFWLSASLAFRSLFLLALPGQAIPRETTASDLSAHDSETLCVRELSSVVAKGLLVQVSEQVVGLNADVGAVELPLHETPEIFHRVRVDVAVHVFDSVVDDGVLVLRLQAVVGFQFVAEDCGASFDALTNNRLKVFLLAGPYVPYYDLAAALHHSERDFLTLRAASSNDALTFRLMHITRLAADEGLVNFDLTGQLRSVLVLHSFANTVEHEPCSLLGQAKVSRNLIATHAVLAVRHQPHGREPLAQRDRRFIEDRADFNGELLPAFRRAALPDPASLEEHRFLGRAVRTLDTLGPALRREIVQRIVRIVEINNRFGQCFGAFHA